MTQTGKRAALRALRTGRRRAVRAPKTPPRTERAEVMAEETWVMGQRTMEWEEWALNPPQWPGGPTGHPLAQKEGG